MGLYLNIILSILVVMLIALLVFRQRQIRQIRPLSDLEKILGKLQKNLLTNRTEGKIQKVAGQISEILTDDLGADRILFFRKQRRFMEMNYVYGLKNIKRGKYRIKLSNPLIRELTAEKLVRRPSALAGLLGNELNELLEQERFNIVFPIFWMNNIFGVYFISTHLPVDHPLIKTLLMFLNQNLAAAYQIKRLESALNLPDSKPAELSEPDETGTTKNRPGREVEEYPGHLIEIFAHRNVDELLTNLFDRIKVGLQAKRLVFMSPKTSTREDGFKYALGFGGEDFFFNGDEYEQIFGELQGRQGNPLDNAVDVPNQDGLNNRLHKYGLNKLTSFSLTEGEPGMLLWAGRDEKSGSETRLLSRFERVGRRAMINALEFERLEEMSYTDSLTRLYNHRYFVKRLSEEIQRAVRYHRGLGLLLFDIDDFKLYNDNFGHQWGDELLRRMGMTLTRSLRSIDIISRYGGDEFCIIMPEADKMTCEIFMERLRQAISSTDFRDQANGFEGRITISVGCALFPNDADNAERLIYYADMALFHSKDMGRNRSTLFTPEILK
ncbi:MAG: GGDEF domain-containing protein [FCB group bacterium]|nr:GGDEF domain-containing protein [FCB group bacterium]